MIVVEMPQPSSNSGKIWQCVASNRFTTHSLYDDAATVCVRVCECVTSFFSQIRARMSLSQKIGHQVIKQLLNSWTEAIKFTESTGNPWYTHGVLPSNVVFFLQISWQHGPHLDRTLKWDRYSQSWQCRSQPWLPRYLRDARLASAAAGHRFL